MGIAELIGIIFFVAIYCLFSYAMFRLGRKFDPDATYGPYLIPIYNLVLLCRCAGMSGWFVLLWLVPYIGGFIFNVVVYGKIARRMGLNFWLYGLLSMLFSLSLFFLAFNSAMPVDREEPPVWQRVAPERQDA